MIIKEGRKNKRGRIPQFDPDVVIYLRDIKNYSFTEIARKMGMKSRQLARYYYLAYKK
jgi:DNA-directed RNA polymerase specialized sigma24 family protein